MMRDAAAAATAAAGHELHIRLPMPHPGQVTVRQQARRFNWLDAGRRWRKTTHGVSLEVEAAVYGGEYGWLAPTFRQVRIGWDEMRSACGDAVKWNESRMEALFPGGGRVRFASLDNPDNVRGWTLDGFVMDEASEIAERAYYEILRPMLMDTGGWAWFIFTPKGQTWTWREWVKAHEGMADGSDLDSMAWQIPSLGCRIVEGTLMRAPHALENPDIPFSELQDMFSRMPERMFRQEILAEFLEDAGGVFRNVAACIEGDVLAGPPHGMAQYVIGIDLAKHADYTVCVVGDLRERRVVAFDRYNKADWGLQKARIIELAKRWNNAIIWMDTTGIGDPIYDDLRRAGLRIHPYKFTSATKTALVENAVLLVEQRRVRFPNIPVLVNELQALQYTRTDAGTLRMAAPEGMHDDAAMAFCLMCWPLATSHAALSQEAREQIAPTRTAPLSEVRGTSILNKQF